VLLRGAKQVQALILHHIGDDSVSLGDLIARGYYQGTNLGYNIAKLGDSGFVTLTEPQWDKRSTRVCLTTSGREVAVFVGSLLDDHSNRLADIGLNEADLLLLSRAFKGLEKHWSSLLTAA
jgi:DNA-binding MarR family transcriptional regulator